MKKSQIMFLALLILAAPHMSVPFVIGLGSVVLGAALAYAIQGD